MTADEINELKNKIKAEFERRKHYGTLEEFVQGQYDFNMVPEIKKVILEEHGKKTIDLLLQIKDKGDLVFVRKDDVIPNTFNSDLLLYMEELKSEVTEGNITSCRSACTGLCVGTCSSSCIGCSGQCNGCTGCTGARS